MKKDIGIVKRSKIMSITLLLAVVFFLYKLMYSGPVSVFGILGVTAVGVVVTYISSLWIENMNVKKPSLYLEILQMSIFVGLEFLFMEAFFYSGLARLYEALLLFIVLLVFVFSTYTAFLTMNLFVVARFEDIPLVSVAKTTSYVLLIIQIFYLSYSVLSMNIPLLGKFPILLAVGSLIIWLELSTVLNYSSLWKSFLDSVVLAYTAFLPVLPAVMWNPYAEFVSLLPAVLIFSIVGTMMHRRHRVGDKTPYLSYFISVILVIYVVVVYR